MKRLEAWIGHADRITIGAAAIIVASLVLMAAVSIDLWLFVALVLAWTVAANRGPRLGTLVAIALWILVVLSEHVPGQFDPLQHLPDCLLLVLSSSLVGFVVSRARERNRKTEQTISDLRHTQAELADSEQRYRVLVENITESVHVKDAEARYVMVNSAMARGTGLPKDQIIGKKATDVYDLETGRKILADDIKVLTTGEIVDTEDLLPIDGRVTVTHVRKVPMRDADGRVVGIVTVARDVTARHRADRELRRLTDILDATPDCVAMVSPTGCLQYLNKAGREYFGIGANAELADMTLCDHLPNWVESAMKTEAMPTAAQKGVWSGEGAIIDRNGAEVPTSQVVIAHRLPNGEVDHFSTVIRDITERKRAEEMLVVANDQLIAWTDELEERNRQSVQLRELGDLLQICSTDQEAYAVVHRCAVQLFPNLSGELYVQRLSRNMLEIGTSWGNSASDRTFAPTECWALRRGRPHVARPDDRTLACGHIDRRANGSDICVSLHAQGETIGMIHIGSDDTPLTENHLRTAEAVSEHVGLALANLRLRETLRNQAIRDVLTGLFNRRYLEETLERELARAMRRQQSVSVLMLDIDHFKRFNDVFGHEAGDILLHNLGVILQGAVRIEDVVCRYGGEEFAVVLPDTPLQQATLRAEEIRSAVKAMHVDYRGQPLGPVTISVGVAASPEHGEISDELLRAADQALYAAKRAGRDQVCAAAGVPVRTLSA